MNKKIKILIVDDHPLVRLGIKEELKRHKCLSLVGEAVSGKSAVDKSKKLKPDVILLDISLPDCTGIEITPVLKKNSNVKIIALSMHNNISYIDEIMKLGADGYILKDSASNELANAIYMVMDGKKYLCSGTTIIQKKNIRNKKRNTDSDNLTSRERQVLINIADGKTNKQIAERLFLSVRTVEVHRNNLKQKLNLKNVAELTKYVLSAKLYTSETN